MPDPCRQEDKIDAIYSTLERLESSHDRLLGLLQQIAEQGAVIKSLRDSISRHEKSFDNLFGRINRLEVQGEGEKVRVGFIVSGISAGTAVVTSLLVKFWKG